LTPRGIDYCHRKDAWNTNIYFLKNNFEKTSVNPAKKNSKRVKQTTHNYKEKLCRNKLGLKKNTRDRGRREAPVN
jgi:hypothetical protein